MQLVSLMWKWCDKKLNTKKPRLFAIVELGENDTSSVGGSQWFDDAKAISTGEPITVSLRDKDSTPMSSFTDEEFENIIMESDKLYDDKEVPES